MKSRVQLALFPATETFVTRSDIPTFGLYNEPSGARVRSILF